MDYSLPGSSVCRILQEESWSGLPCPPLGDLPDPGFKHASLMSPALADGFITTSTAWEALISYQFSSVAQPCPNLCNPMDCGTPGFPVLHQLPELTQLPVHRVGDAILPSHPLSSPSPPTFNLSQHQGLFQLVSSSQLQHQSFQ